MKIPLFPLTALLVGACIVSLHAQKMATPTGEAPGPWILGTIGVGKQPDGSMKTTALKGIAIKVGEKGEAAVAYDLDLCRMAGAWTGKFTTPMNLMSRGEFPTAMGEVLFVNDAVKGWAFKPIRKGKTDEELAEEDPHLEKLDLVRHGETYGPLLKEEVQFKGFHQSGNRVVLEWQLGDVQILEEPGFEIVDGQGFVTRTLSFSHEVGQFFALLASNTGVVDRGTSVSGEDTSFNLDACTRGETSTVSVDLHRAESGFSSATHCGANHQWLVSAFFHGKHLSKLYIWQGKTSERERVFNLLDASRKQLSGLAIRDPKEAMDGGPAHWPETVVTKGDVSDKMDEAYVVDTIKLPDPNPWNAPMFVGGFDFFPDGRAAVCTFHGDVFIVSGIDDKLEHVTWKRFASGLYHALGLKIVNGEIYVTCRDGIWRLKDLNNDGECDFYEAFNHDVMVTKSFHEFVFDLQTDSAGNFYFAKAGPVKNGGRGFDEICAHHGSMFRVSADGKKFGVIATGFRAPNGIGCGPHGELTSGDNEGTWTPVCKINWIKPGGFYGVVPLAHRDPPPTDYDRPLCWLPRRVDNSGGDQVWVTSDKWGPWKDQLLHLSYGTCSVFGVMKEAVRRDALPRVPDQKTPADQNAGEVGRAGAHPSVQGGVVRFSLNFQSGIMRARFNPKDGQLYVAGLRGWQTTGVKNGAFQRVRYTGAPVRMPIGLHATKRGVKLDFTCALDPATANDPQNWNVEVWNYIWSSAYGSPEISTLDATEKPGELGKDGEAQFTKVQMAQKKHDPLTVKSATLSADKKSVFLEIPDIKPVMQMAIKFGIQSADGAELRSEVVNTIHTLGSE